MDSEFITFQKFNDIALAENLIDILEQHGIQYLVSEESPVFNPAFILNNETANEYAVKIKSEDFDRANQLLQEEEESVDVNEVEADYYLFKFGDDELMDVIIKADEWSAFDYVLALKILAERGKTISEQEIAHIKENRIAELKEPDPSQKTWIIIGYITAILGGLIGIFIGWHLSSFKKTLPNGEKVYGYNDHDRRQGIRIFWIAVVMLFIWVSLRIFIAYNY